MSENNNDDQAPQDYNPDEAHKEEERQRAEAAHSLRQHVSYNRENLEIHEEMIKDNAKLIAARFKGLVEGGLTREEALQFVCTRGLA